MVEDEAFRSPAAPLSTRVHFYFSPERFFRAPAVAHELYFNIHTIPLFTLPVQAIVNPEIISEYVFLGPPWGLLQQPGKHQEGP